MKTEPIHIRRGLSLYKQPITGKGGSPYWYARVWMRSGERCIHTKSTSTTDEAAARRFAEDFYGDCLIRKRYGDNPALGSHGSASPTRRFDVVADQWLKQKKAIAGSDPKKLRGYDDARKLLTAPNGLGAFFKRSDIASITTNLVRQYLCFAAEHSKKGRLASTTQRNHLSALNGILKFAAEQGIIPSAPLMPRLRLKDNPRPCFTELEFSELCLTAGVLKRREGYVGNDQAAAEWQELEDFLIFMVATFLRAGEWKELRQQHCRIVYGDHPYLEVAVPNGKTHKRRVVSMPEAITVWQRIIERDGDDAERFLFKSRYSNRDTAQERMRDKFEELLKETRLQLDEFGSKRTVYSLRHTSLMFRLINGQNVDLLMLARNAGTSVDQLERFYLSHADPAMKVANLHSMKSQPKIEYVELPERPRSGIQLEAALEEPFTEALA